MHAYTTHKWGFIALSLYCSAGNCKFDMRAISHDLKPRDPYFVVARNVYEAVASGYAYHKLGAECWLDDDFHPNPYPKGGNDYMRRQPRWWWTLNVTRTMTKEFSQIENFCEVLASLPEPIGLKMYSEFAFYKWYQKALDFLTENPKSKIVCLNDLNATMNAKHSSHENMRDRQKHREIVVTFANGIHSDGKR